LDRDGLSGQKYSEAAEVLTYLSGKDAPEVLPALHAFLKQTQSTDPDVRFWVGYTLVRLNRQEGIPLLLETLGINSFADWSYDWNDDLCRMGHAAISAEDKLIDLARHAKWPVVTRMTVRVLGCIGSTKAIPLLTKMLQEPDWKLNIAAARALATIGVLHNDSARGLERLASDHWSAKVRRAASEALARLNGEQRPPAPAPQTTHGIETSEVVVVGGDPLPYNHGLPWCDDSGRFSVDGRQWFRAQWIEPAIEKEPDIIPKRLLQTRGTQTFLQVDDGWLMGSRGFESQGFLVHVSLDGRVQDFAGGSALYYNASISAIVRVHGKYLAVGNESRRGTDEDLLALTRARDGTWSSERVVALPGVPNAYAISPRGDLLLRDDANRYAILGHEIVPLQCEKQRAGSYFDNHREEIETD
jgi:hypothetical protein